MTTLPHLIYNIHTYIKRCSRRAVFHLSKNFYNDNIAYWIGSQFKVDDIKIRNLVHKSTNLLLLHIYYLIIYLFTTFICIHKLNKQLSDIRMSVIFMILSMNSPLVPSVTGFRLKIFFTYALALSVILFDWWIFWICLSKPLLPLFSGNVASQCGHLTGLFPSWTDSTCDWRIYLVENSTSQSAHLNFSASIPRWPILDWPQL